MSEQPAPSEPLEPSVAQTVSGGATVQSTGDANVGGDVVGRDKILQTSTTVTNVGMAPEAVRRLVISVGVLVLVTAFCFFSGGIVVGFAALQAFQRPIPSTPAAAQDFQASLNQVQALPPGQAFQWAYTEADLSSYLHFILGPQIGFDARARLLSGDEVAFQGNWSGLLGLPVTVVTRMETNSPQLYHTVSAAVQILPLPNSNFGWVALPASAVQPLVDAINQNIGEGYTAKAIDFPQFESVASGETAPPLDAALRIIGLSATRQR
jgi:hypothetical protein